ncbi:MAG: DUF305 domain-containing protein [Actinophytocola sp.]|uniref:DUF305 domain-containing protein n=1 Tax=Actinophytocola sp. TaxID=1872138 RepID=UPI00132B8B55|nr:DUF305 domain-containing protein [Actinophytocola sp.]MPZ83549.1 DUF305 domain-containing protein [Actinophytocola sp.]
MKRLLLVAAVLLLAGCGTPVTATTGTVESAPPLPGNFNDTDVMFLQMMVPHHEQGVRMARLAQTRAAAVEVRDLAAAVVATQTDEVEDMTAWLRAWNQPIEADPDAHAHAGHGGMRMTDPAVVASLADTPAAAFDRTFLNLFTGHQHGAVELARMETGDGKDPQARELASRIVESRTAQVRQMARLLDT